MERRSFNPLRTVGIFAAACAAFVANLHADVRLPALFTDHMVLQRATEVPIWGWADEGEKIIVQFRDQRIQTTAVGGKWSVKLKHLSYGGPDTLTVLGKNRLDIDDVLVGEVWICSGQSNMEWPMHASYQPQGDIAAANNSKLRLFTVPKLKSDKPVDDVKSSWQLTSPETVKNFSAVGYYFGLSLQQSLGVPVGLIHTSWGGSPAEVWMSNEVLSSNPEYKRDILDPFPAQLKNFQNSVAQWEKETADLKAQGKEQTRGRPWGIWSPSELYNGMIAPLIPYAVKGAIWYQGESNAGRAHQYRTLFRDMIQNWRDDWNNQDLAFFAVQLAPWDKNRKRTIEQITEKPGDSDWAELREAQNIAAQSLSKAGIAVITDAGDKDDIHPAKKKPAGERLAIAARGITYGEKIVYSGPTYKGMEVKKDKIVIHFDHVGDGLVAREGELTGFAIAGADQKFVWAKAEISKDGKTVIVSSPDVLQPVAVRYGWADYPVVNLWNLNDLPASPFRTDSFPMVTQPRL